MTDPGHQAAATANGTVARSVSAPMAPPPPLFFGHSSATEPYPYPPPMSYTAPLSFAAPLPFPMSVPGAAGHGWPTGAAWPGAAWPVSYTVPLVGPAVHGAEVPRRRSTAETGVRVLLVGMVTMAAAYGAYRAFEHYCGSKEPEVRPAPVAVPASRPRITGPERPASAPAPALAMAAAPAPAPAVAQAAGRRSGGLGGTGAQRPPASRGSAAGEASPTADPESAHSQTGPDDLTKELRRLLRVFALCPVELCSAATGRFLCDPGTPGAQDRPNCIWTVERVVMSPEDTEATGDTDIADRAPRARVRLRSMASGGYLTFAEPRDTETKESQAESRGGSSKDPVPGVTDSLAALRGEEADWHLVALGAKTVSLYHVASGRPLYASPEGKRARPTRTARRGARTEAAEGAEIQWRVDSVRQLFDGQWTGSLFCTQSASLLRLPETWCIKPIVLRGPQQAGVQEWMVQVVLADRPDQGLVSYRLDGHAHVCRTALKSVDSMYTQWNLLFHLESGRFSLRPQAYAGCVLAVATDTRHTLELRLAAQEDKAQTHGRPQAQAQVQAAERMWVLFSAPSAHLMDTAPPIRIRQCTLQRPGSTSSSSSTSLPTGRSSSPQVMGTAPSPASSPARTTAGWSGLLGSSRSSAGGTPGRPMEAASVPSVGASPVSVDQGSLVSPGGSSQARQPRAAGPPSTSPASAT